MPTPSADDGYVTQTSDFYFVVLPPIGLIAVVVLAVVAVIVVVRRLRR